jgi:hypothetical protein
MEVLIDGKRYIEESDFNEAMRLLREVYGALWTEAHYDPYNESTQKFATPLADKMREANRLLHFKK